MNELRKTYNLRSTKPDSPFKPRHRSSSVGDTLRQGPEEQPEYFTLTLVRQKDTGITENIEENQNENERSENEDNTTISGETPPAPIQGYPEGTNREKEASISTMANITISSVETGEKTPALPQFISPPTFNPCTDSAQSFLATYDRTAVANNWNDALKILYFHSFLQGAANIWYTEYKQAHPDSNWHLIGRAFKAEFCDDYGSLRLLSKVRKEQKNPRNQRRIIFTT